MAFCIALVVGGDGLGLARQLEEGDRQMAVARGVLLQVVLVVVLGGIEIAQREMLHGEGLAHGPLLVGQDLVDGGCVGLIDVVDARAILCAPVAPLLVDAGGVDGLEVEVEEKGESDPRGVIDDANRLGKSGLVGADLLTRWGGLCGRWRSRPPWPPRPLSA